MLACLSMLKGKVKKEKKPFPNFVEKRFPNLQPEDSLVTTRGAGKQAPMILGQERERMKRALSIYVAKKAT